MVYGFSHPLSHARPDGFSGPSCFSKVKSENAEPVLAVFRLFSWRGSGCLFFLLPSIIKADFRKYNRMSYGDMAICSGQTFFPFFLYKEEYFVYYVGNETFILTVLQTITLERSRETWQTGLISCHSLFFLLFIFSMKLSDCYFILLRNYGEK